MHEAHLRVIACSRRCSCVDGRLPLAQPRQQHRAARSKAAGGAGLTPAKAAEPGGSPAHVAAS